MGVEISVIHDLRFAIRIYFSRGRSICYPLSAICNLHFCFSESKRVGVRVSVIQGDVRFVLTSVGVLGYG